MPELPIPLDGGPRLRLVSLYEQLGDVYAHYDADARKLEATQPAQLTEAHRYYEKGFEALSEIDESFKIPNSILQDRAIELQERLAKSNPPPRR